MAKNPFPKAPVKTVKAGRVRFGGGAPLALIAGPCVIESREMAFDLAARLAALAQRRAQFERRSRLPARQRGSALSLARPLRHR